MHRFLPILLGLLIVLSCTDSRHALSSPVDQGPGSSFKKAPANPASSPPSVPRIQPKKRIVIRGTVRDLRKQGIAGAVVKVQRSEFSSVTRADGSYEIAVDPKLALPAIVAAAKDGYLNGAIDVFDLVGPWDLLLGDLPVADNTRTSFIPNKDCKGCHQGIYGDWLASHMGRTGMNRWVHDLLDGKGTSGGTGGFVYQRDSIHRVKHPNADCSSCHTPGLSRNAHGASMGDPNNPTQKKLDSVGCDVCHKVRDVDLRYMNYPGVHEKLVKFHQPKNDLLNPVVFGTLPDVTFSTSPMQPAYSKALASGHLVCVACHEDNVDHDGDGDYEDAGSIENQSTYSEWQASPYATSGKGRQTCVDCHMWKTTRDKIATIQAVPGRTVRSHDFEGHEKLSSPPSSLKVTAKRLPGAAVEVLVDLSNDGAGHSMPTGVFIRNYILLVEGKQGSSKLLQTAGPKLDKIAGVGSPAAGYYSGLPGKVYTKVFEDAQGNWPVYATEAAKIRYDTRLKAKATDKLRFVFAASATSKVNVRVRLIYRKSYRAFIDAKGWKTTGLGAVLPDIQAPHFGKAVHDLSRVVN